MHCHRGSNHPRIQKYKTYTYFNRTARQNASKKSATEGGVKKCILTRYKI